jgi:hypothetical protein
MFVGRQKRGGKTTRTKQSLVHRKDVFARVARFFGSKPGKNIPNNHEIY